MMVSLMGLPDTLRGVAWLSSARAVRCWLKCQNERDPRVYLQASLFEGVHYKRTARVSGRKAWATIST